MTFFTGGASPDVDPATVTDVWPAVINVHDSNVSQVEAAIIANTHTLDPHPAQPGKYVKRHPIYLVAVDYSKIDANGHPAEGAPTELTLAGMRSLFTARPEYAAFVDGGDVPENAIVVEGMYYIPELDQAGNPTGRVKLGNAT